MVILTIILFTLQTIHASLETLRVVSPDEVCANLLTQAIPRGLRGSAESVKAQVDLLIQKIRLSQGKKRNIEFHPPLYTAHSENGLPSVSFYSELSDRQSVLVAADPDFFYTNSDPSLATQRLAILSEYLSPFLKDASLPQTSILIFPTYQLKRLLYLTSGQPASKDLRSWAAIAQKGLVENPYAKSIGIASGALGSVASIVAGRHYLSRSMDEAPGIDDEVREIDRREFMGGLQFIVASLAVVSAGVATGSVVREALPFMDRYYLRPGFDLSFAIDKVLSTEGGFFYSGFTLRSQQRVDVFINKENVLFFVWNYTRKS